MVQTHRERLINVGWELYNLVGSPGGATSELGETEYYVRTAKTRGSNRIYNQFTTTTTVDKVIYTNLSKAPWKANT